MRTGLVACAAIFVAAGSAMGQLTADGLVGQADAKFRLSRSGNVQEVPWFASDREPIVDIYNNTTTPQNLLNGGANYLGDLLLTTGIGDIREFDFSIGNSSAATGPLTRVDIDIQFYESSDGTNFTLLDTLIFNDISLGAGLAPGSFTVFTLTDPGVSLSQTNVIAAVRLYDPIGTGNASPRHVLAHPPTVGSSSNTSLAVGNTAGITGFTSVAGTNNNVLFRIAVPSPGSLALLGLGGLMAGRRRR